MEKLKLLILGDWGKWKDVACTLSMGYIGIIQTRTHNKTNKRQIRKQRIWVNDGYITRKIQENMFN